MLRRRLAPRTPQGQHLRHLDAARHPLGVRLDTGAPSPRLTSPPACSPHKACLGSLAQFCVLWAAEGAQKPAYGSPGQVDRMLHHPLASPAVCWQHTALSEGLRLAATPHIDPCSSEVIHSLPITKSLLYMVTVHPCPCADASDPAFVAGRGRGAEQGGGGRPRRGAAQDVPGLALLPGATCGAWVHGTWVHGH